MPCTMPSAPLCGTVRESVSTKARLASGTLPGRSRLPSPTSEMTLTSRSGSETGPSHPNVKASQCWVALSATTLLLRITSRAGALRLLRSQYGPRAAAWLGTVPSEAGTTIPPDRMLIALRRRRRLRLPLLVAQGRCGAHGPGCGAAVDVYGDHYAAC